MSGWCCVELVEGTAVVFPLILLLSNVPNFHAAMASTLVSAVSMVPEVNVGRHEHDKITSFEGIYL